MKNIYLFLLLLSLSFATLAQSNYSFTNTRIVVATYTDISTSGTAIPMSNLESGSSTVAQSIGFDFTFNGTVFTQFMIHADGILKFGTTAPGASTIIVPSPSYSYANVFTNTTSSFQNVVMPLFLDLVQGTSAPEFHILTTGTAPNRITTIQWKNLRDADNPSGTTQHQFDNMEFQVRLFETSNNIELVYGNWVASANPASIRGSAIGIKASSSSFISYTKNSSLLAFEKGNNEDPASTNSRVFYLEQEIKPVIGTTLLYFGKFADDVNVAKLYFDEVVPQNNTVGKNIRALIKNEGTTTASNIPVTLLIGGINNNTETVNIASLASGASEIVTFATVAGSLTGLQTVTVSVNPSSDSRVENNSVQTTQTISKNVVKIFGDDKKSTNGFGFNGVLAKSATKIFGTGVHNVSQVRVSFNSNSILAEISIYEDDGVDGSPGATPIYTSTQFRTNNLSEVIVAIPSTVTVIDDYYVVVSQKETGNMTLSLYSQYPRNVKRSYNALYATSNWVESSSSFLPFMTVVEESNSVDVGFEKITSPGCAQTEQEIVKGTIRNFSNQLHDYALNPVTVTGFVKDELKNISIPFSFVKNTGTIAPGGRDTVTLLNSLDFSSRGKYVFVANTSCAADAEPLNDSISYSILPKITFSGVPQDSICPQTSMAISIASSYLREPKNFFASSDGTLFSPSSTLVVAPNATTIYFAQGLDYRGCTIYDSVVIKVKSLGVPAPPIITTLDSVQSYKNDFTVVLNAPALAGHTITWLGTGIASNGGTTYTVAPTSAIGTASSHKAYYTRIADGCSSIFSNEITATFATGLLLSSNFTTVCDTSFYDNGGPQNNYTNTIYLKTYTPSDPSKKLKLTLNKIGLGQFGSIMIYDGPTISSPLIATISYNTPATSKFEFVASNPDGVLTISFDPGNTMSGFLGGLSCQSPEQFRSIANGVFSDPLIWESRPIGGSIYSNATRAPSKGDDTIQVYHNVNVNKSIPIDQLFVEQTGTLQLTGTNTSLIMYKTIPEDELIIKGIFVSSPGTYIGRNTSNIALYGTLENNSLMEADSVKVLENTVPAILSGNGTMTKLIVNSSHGATVNGNLKINKGLALINGIVKVNSPNYINLVAGLSPTITGGNPNSYVEGKLRRQIFSTPDSILFPLGINGIYRPLRLLTNQTSYDNAVEYEAEMKQGVAPARTLPSSLTSLNDGYYHHIGITGGASYFTDAKLAIEYGTGDGVTDAQYLRIAKDDGGTNWLDLGGTGTANGSGTITSATFTSFSDFVLANALGGSNPLPLYLWSFKAIAQPLYNQLIWKTENETNVSHFTVEKSSDALSFLPIGNITAKQNNQAEYSFKDDSNFETEKANNVYYRLKIVDRDGGSTFSSIVKIENANAKSSSKFNIYPNPIKTNFTINSLENAKAIITNAIGQTMVVLNLRKGKNIVDASSWPSGVYLLKTEHEQSRFIKQ